MPAMITMAAPEREYNILSFGAGVEVVSAILAGTKTQHRRWKGVTLTSSRPPLRYRW